MTRTLVWRLMLKDWYLTRTTLAIIAVVGTLSVGSLYLRQGVASLVGMIASLFAVIFLGILVPQQTILNERKRQNLAFVMSLPVSPMQYTMAKILANLAAFLALWLPIVVGMIGTVAATGGFGGIIPLMLVAALAPFSGFALFIAVAIVTESEVVSITTMAATNVSYSFIWLFLSLNKDFWQDMRSPVPVWSALMVSTLAVEAAVIVLAFGLTCYLQSKKTDFI
jgi:ABC-type transport system involved in multi-copper enzyme maturation permease subunit